MRQPAYIPEPSFVLPALLIAIEARDARSVRCPALPSAARPSGCTRARQPAQLAKRKLHSRMDPSK